MDQQTDNKTNRDWSTLFDQPDKLQDLKIKNVL